MKKKMKNIILDLLSIAVLICLCFSEYRFVQEYMKIRKSEKVHDDVVNIVKESQPDADPDDGQFHFTKKSWQALKKQNSDFTGWIQWDTGLVSQPFVQTDNNDYYLTHNIEKQFDYMGAAFMDSDASVFGQNITIYGHTVFYTGSDGMFTPLNKLRKQDVLDQNQTFKIYWQNRVASYQVKTVSIVDTGDKNAWQFERHYFAGSSDVQNWVNEAQSCAETSEPAEVTGDSKFVTLQTCRDPHSNIRVVVLGVETGSEDYQ